MIVTRKIKSAFHKIILHKRKHLIIFYAYRSRILKQKCFILFLHIYVFFILYTYKQLCLKPKKKEIANLKIIIVVSHYEYYKYLCKIFVPLKFSSPKLKRGKINQKAYTIFHQIHIKCVHHIKIITQHKFALKYHIS